MFSLCINNIALVDPEPNASERENVCVRGNEASHSAQNLWLLKTNVTCECEIKHAQSEWSLLSEQLSRLLCVHTVRVCSRWHTGCSLFSVGKQWDCLPPADTVWQQKFNLPFCCVLMTNRFGKFYQNDGTYIYLSACTPCSSPVKIN